TIRTSVHPNIHTPGLEYTAFILWDHFNDLSDEELAAAELDGPVSDVVTAARKEIKEYFKDRDAARREEQVKLWVDDGIYPYDKDPEDEL
ncbi:ATP-binding protein, partial [Mycobacterium tuberculosis]|nr:ATP-binding protein [Mycobacterium tuberculosis]